MRRTSVAKVVRRIGVFASVASVAAACGGKHYLNEYRFTERTLAVVFIEPPSPSLRHGWFSSGIDSGSNAIQGIIQAGSKVAKELEARKAQRRLDSASQRVDLPTLLAARTGERANRYLSTSAAATSQQADYVLEMTMLSFGIDARSEHQTRLFVKAEAVLTDRRTGREIWSEKVTGTDRLTPFWIGNATVPSDVVNAIALNQITVDQFQQALEQLVAFTATRISDELREDLRDVRDK